MLLQWTTMYENAPENVVSRISYQYFLGKGQASAICSCRRRPEQLLEEKFRLHCRAVSSSFDLTAMRAKVFPFHFQGQSSAPGQLS